MYGRNDKKASDSNLSLGAPFLASFIRKPISPLTLKCQNSIKTNHSTWMPFLPFRPASPCSGKRGPLTKSGPSPTQRKARRQGAVHCHRRSAPVVLPVLILQGPGWCPPSRRPAPTTRLMFIPLFSSPSPGRVQRLSPSHLVDGRFGDP